MKAFLLLLLAASTAAAQPPVPGGEQRPPAGCEVAGPGLFTGEEAARPFPVGSVRGKLQLGPAGSSFPAEHAAAGAQRRFWRRAGWDREPRHRIEARFGVWRRPRFSFNESRRDLETSSADFAFGVEYLRLVAYDVAIGVGAQTRVRGTEERLEDRDRSSSTGHTTVAVPFVARWNFARRLTRWRTIEPYVTGGAGPVIRADWATEEFDGDRESRTDVETAFGARTGLGFDAHIGSVWTLGVVAAWNWVEKPGRVIGYGRHDRGGEVSVTMGWVFGR